MVRETNHTKNNATTKMNTMIYVETPKEKNHGLHMRLEEGFIMIKSTKKYKALDTADYANFHYTQFTYTL